MARTRFTALRRAVFVLPLGAALAATLISCAAPPDPHIARESLAEVTQEAPAPPLAAELYDAEGHPEPIVEPLECSPYLVVTARGTGEPSNGQLLGPVARAISKWRPKAVEVVDLAYPADVDVNEGGTYGVRMLIDTLNVQAEECPRQRFVLLGYSQGALVVGDALSEPTQRLVGETTGQLTERASDAVAAVVLYGNPRFVGSEPYNAGTHVYSAAGLLPREAGTLAQFADRMRDFCVAEDFVCQSSLNLDESGHVAYYDNGMQQEGAEFAIDLLAGRDPDTDESDTDDSSAGGSSTDDEPDNAG